MNGATSLGTDCNGPAQGSAFTARFGMVVILCLYALVAIFAPVLAPYGEAEVFP